MSIPLFCFAVSWAASSDFWNHKPSTEWSEEEIGRLVSQSPWAQGARLIPRRLPRGEPIPDFSNEARNKAMQDGPGAATPVPITGRQDREVTRPLELTVRWESGEPLIEALRTPLPPDFAGHYVIGVVGFPGGEALATLQAKGKEPLQAGVVHTSRTGEMLFGFSRDLLPLGAKDRDLEFILETPLFTIKAKFDPKVMVYRGSLTL